MELHILVVGLAALCLVAQSTTTGAGIPSSPTESGTSVPIANTTETGGELEVEQEQELQMQKAWDTLHLFREHLVMQSRAFRATACDADPVDNAKHLGLNKVLSVRVPALNQPFDFRSHQLQRPGPSLSPSASPSSDAQSRSGLQSWRESGLDKCEVLRSMEPAIRQVYYWTLALDRVNDEYSMSDEVNSVMDDLKLFNLEELPLWVRYLRQELGCKHAYRKLRKAPTKLAMRNVRELVNSDGLEATVLSLVCLKKQLHTLLFPETLSIR